MDDLAGQLHGQPFEAQSASFPTGAPTPPRGTPAFQAGPLADDFVEHEETPGFPPTKEGVLRFFRAYRTAFPDLRMDAEDVLASGDKTVARVRATGTHHGELMGTPPTGKHVDVELIDIMKFDDAGMVREHWGVVDTMSMMQQLGVAPPAPR